MCSWWLRLPPRRSSCRAFGPVPTSSPSKAYFSKDGKPVTDLKPEEIELLEDSRPQAIERVTRDTINWAQRDRVNTTDPRENEIALCYPENDSRRPQFRGIAKEMIERRREQKTLRALDELIAHLATLSDERKFVVLLSEGWVLFRQNNSLGAVLEPDSVPSLPPVGPGSARVPGGTAKVTAYDRGFESCERERSMLAFVDHALEVRQLSQRANRANVTFYVVDPR